MQSPRYFKAFSLIELLVTVVIISILSAIGVVSLLQAQSRTRVTRAKTDMRTLATAIESYNVDHQAYPIPADKFGVLASSNPASGFETRISPVLTTPLAYIRTLIDEPFPGGQAQEAPLFHYSTRAYFQNPGNPLAYSTATTADLDGYVGSVYPSLVGSVEFFVLSHGPDGDHDTPGQGSPALYDPTNGVVSNGDVVYWGPGSGLKN